jgi:pyruvate/2-oxoglutarate dehydrogenase complex dihydrolipoamide acyltransferase (E2) component
MNKGIKITPLSFNRRAVIASASVTKKKNTIHSLTEVDITLPRKYMKDHFEKTGQKLSLTAYLVTCLSRVVKDHPYVNSFNRGRKQIFLDDVTVSVLIERELDGEKFPEPIGIKSASEKTCLQISQEIRGAKIQNSGRLGSLTGQTWINLIPGFLLKLFVRIADKNINMAKKYGKVAVTSVGMFSQNPVWFIPHGTATVLMTVGSINHKVVEIDQKFMTREYLCLTVSFDHNIVDGAPASRFTNQLIETIKNGELLNKK